MSCEMHANGGRRPGAWLRCDQDGLEAWLAGFVQRTEAKRPTPLHPVIAEFRDLIDRDPLVRMYLTEMIAQVPESKPYREHHVKSVEQMLCLINEVLTTAPSYDETILVGTPLNAILDWSMGTPAGFAAFRDDKINAMLRKILDAWCAFLSRRESLYVLNDSPRGWKSPAARKALQIEDYQHDPEDEAWGFQSWNDFFTRRFKTGRRPIADPGNNKVIVSACESTPFKIATGVKRCDRFWIKGQPYSLQDMLAGDESVDEFVGGTVYQAFLNVFNYHRWHSPVTGTIKKAFVKRGTYFSEAESEGMDPAGPNLSQGYIAHVATRALVFIDCDDPLIGLMCVVLVGMAEVSSCVILPEIKPGHRVEKGDELGYFQYGGSTHCLVFRPGVIADFSLNALPDPGNAQAPAVLLGSKVATAR
jgi:phosphatidylserine decarboxylase